MVTEDLTMSLSAKRESLARGLTPKKWTGKGESFAAKERQEMKGKKHSPEQIVKILREAEGAKSAREVIRRYQIAEQTFYRWKKVYAGMEVSDIRRLKAMQEENQRLKWLVADQALKIALLEELNAKKW